MGERRRFQSVLDAAAAIAMIAAAGAMVWFIVVRSANPEPRPAPSYKVGETLKTVPDLDLQSSAQALLVFLREGCRYCRESVSFYRDLTTRPHMIPVVVLSSDEPQVLATFLTAHSIEPDAWRSVGQSDPKLSATPLMLLVDSQAKIEQLWRGKLRSADEEAKVLDIVRKGKGSSNGRD